MFEFVCHALPLIAQLDLANCTLPRQNYFITKYDVPSFVTAYICIMFAYICIYLYIFVFCLHRKIHLQITPQLTSSRIIFSSLLSQVLKKRLWQGRKRPRRQIPC